MKSFVIGPSTGSRLLVGLVLSCLVDVVIADPRSFTVIDARPVAKAVLELESVFGWPITYEDPPYAHASEVIDLTAAVRRDGDHRRRVLAPRGGSLSVAYDRPSVNAESLGTESSVESLLALKGAASTAIAQVVQGEAALRGPQQFTVVESNGLFHVVPAKVLDASGRILNAKPLLDTRISVLPKHRTAGELIDEICHSLSLATGERVVVGTVPSKLLSYPTAVTATDEAARSVLSRLLVDLPADLSWRLLRDPGLRWYALNLHVVPVINK